MSLTKEQLLIHRVMCVGGKEGEPNYPGSPFKSGDILKLGKSELFYWGVDKDEMISVQFVDQFPHLFRPMLWWEGRKPEEMLSLDQEWVDIIGYEGLYQVSNLGIVKGLTRTITRPFKGSEYLAIKKERILLFNKRKDGYLTVQLSKNDKVSTFYVHRLVANAFIPKIKGKDCVNHIDSKRDNPMCENLEWCTYSENLIHAVKYNDYCGKIKNRKKPSRKPTPLSEYQEYQKQKEG